MLWIVLIGWFGVVALLVGGLSRLASGSRAVGIAAGAIAGVLAAYHAIYAVILGVGEYEESRSGYDRLVEDHWVELLLVYTLGPAIVLVAGHALWRRRGGVSPRARRDRAPRRAPAS